jgi:FkbM family methyltransferase
MWKRILELSRRKTAGLGANSESSTQTGPIPGGEAIDAGDQKISEPLFYSLNGLDRKLREKISKRNGYFVELGANNGIDQSNTLHFENELGWRGVLVEPIPHRYLECIQNRAADNAFFCNACVSNEYSKEFVKIIYSNLMSVAPELDLDLPRSPAEHAALGAQFLARGEQPFEFGAIARTLTSILDEAKAPAVIDLLSLDVEGAERDVLLGIDFRRYSFENIVVECRDLSQINGLLIENGYTLVEPLSEQDYHYALNN